MQAWTIRRARCSGFNLMEVLVAMGLFAFGFVAVAAIIPAGALLQKNTATDVQGRHVERNASAIVQSTAMTYAAGDTSTDLGGYHAVAGSGQNMLIPFDTSWRSLADIWSVDSLSYPSTIADRFSRSFYWVPLICDKNGDPTNPAWQMVVFVMRREENKEYEAQWFPDVYASSPTKGSLPGLRYADVINVSGSTFTLQSGIRIRQNDPIADSNGGTYRVVSVNSDHDQITVNNNISQLPAAPTIIWYAPAGDDPLTSDDDGVTDDYGRSPAVAVFTVTDLRITTP
jgi:hypothetical protein